MYREQPDQDSELPDSGWRFFAGDETDDYVNTPDNIGVYSLKTLVALDCSILPYLNSPYGSEYIRVDNGFEKV